MKHSLELHSDVLTPRELSLISVVFDTIVQRSGVVLGSLPEWFAISAEKWDKAHVSKIPEGEEKCLRTAAAWIELNHPNIRKLFGACHVIHAAHVTLMPYVQGKPRRKVWEGIYEATLGLKYVNERGTVHGDLEVRGCEHGAKL
ncbi:hypothetical protein PHYSODRAFT_476153 [Phytophthora sojae]|uniref:Protein kinase domain-containing protein n=1 Tax=Phytophthora sojae (strain P6497) TaxID=1094619 RepID=G4YMV6_PHYSP|nr:hypothetical protein PHYSODRAFT_476153 [Phytophthora sojae]EGZ29301.1 hypothetical protein PHYSODRAFT_476153 [Phytophthora sojae]|eukprot:XP_009516576.1 hypothetical protein PHYSODRAFT_476153 [Phytophthora sojae]